MHDDQEMARVVTCAFFLGVVFKVKLEKKHDYSAHSDEYIKEIERQLDVLLSQLHPDNLKYLTDKRAFYDMALITDLYSWSDVA